MPLAAGTRLDSYEVIAPLGAGGMGEVYRARDLTLKRDVAIKVLPEYWSRDPERLRRFEQEAQATAALNHPNIVSIFHVGQYDGSPYIVTELLQGETLRDRLRKGPMRLLEVLDHGVELAHGLAAAHDAGIVHRDLKPDNIWITKDGRIKILDFGLAKLDPAKAPSTDGETVSLQLQSHPGQVLGTVGYMSPEQVRGQAADARSDIFAVGVILYEMLTGKPAFRKSTSADTMSAILNEDPPAVSQIAPSVPPGLQRVVNRCLAKNPDQRFQHASDLGFALESLSDSSGSTITTVNQAAPNKKWIWIATGAIAIAITAAFVFWWRQPLAMPVVEAVTQLTDDGEAKSIFNSLLTDGSRVYFNQGTAGGLKIAEVSVTGGPTAIIPTRFAIPHIVGLTREGSTLLALVGPASVPALPLWTIPLPAGEPRRLGGIEAADAGFASEGHILFSQANDLYIADNDGSNPRKLLSAAGPIGEPNISPDSKHLVFTVYSQSANSILVSNADGSDQRTIVSSSEGRRVCCAQWTPDGSYITFEDRNGGRPDLWVARWQVWFFQRVYPHVQLTNGPLTYKGPSPSRDGKQIFAIGTKQRGELVRYDVNSKQFVPILSGISAFNPTFSSDGKWVAYTSYPDHTLWRSRSDGSDRLQLTYPPEQVQYPFISADGTRVAYGNSLGEIYVISLDGGSPQRIVGKNSWGASWSPDGNQLVFADYSDRPHTQFQFLDLRTWQHSVVPGSQDLIGVQWIAENLLVAASRDRTKLVAFDVRTQKWSDLVSMTTPGDIVNWAHSPDYKYVYYTVGGAEPQTLRLKLADHRVELITSLKDLPRAAGPDGNTQISVAPDGSAVFTRDIGTQEIYALTVKWP
jgi:serine/threonine protein kinase/Tol biopolymer transport system component